MIEILNKLTDTAKDKNLQIRESIFEPKYNFKKSFLDKDNSNRPIKKTPAILQNFKLDKTKKRKKKSIKQVFRDQGLIASRQRIYFYKNFKERLKRNKMKKSLRYIYYVKKFKNGIEYTNVRLLKVFLTKYARIKAKRKTRINSQQHRFLSKCIKKARIFGLLPFCCNLRIF